MAAVARGTASGSDIAASGMVGTASMDSLAIPPELQQQSQQMPESLPGSIPDMASLPAAYFPSGTASQHEPDAALASAASSALLADMPSGRSMPHGHHRGAASMDSAALVRGGSGASGHRGAVAASDEKQGAAAASREHDSGDAAGTSGDDGAPPAKQRYRRRHSGHSQVSAASGRRVRLPFAGSSVTVAASGGSMGERSGSDKLFTSTGKLRPPPPINTSYVLLWLLLLVLLMLT